MSDVLNEILAHKREEVAAARQRIGEAELAARAAEQAAPRGFAAALSSQIERGRAAVIAELKKASPSKGLIRADFDPAWLAARYAEGGARCLSVLTDREYFQGAPDYLRQAREACALPVLRKDFMVDPYQIVESRAWGADAILLIVAALGREQLQELHAAALEHSLDVLIEVHDAEELRRALELPGGLLGINNRNLRTFETRLETTLELLPAVPRGRALITESGIGGAADMQRMQQAGVHGFLIGETLMRQADPGLALRAWLDDQQTTAV